jgi:hypothetical protein
LPKYQNILITIIFNSNSSLEVGLKYEQGLMLSSFVFFEPVLFVLAYKFEPKVIFNDKYLFSISLIY